MMYLKTFTTHTLAVIKDVQAIELSFNVWSSENRGVRIVRTEYSIQKRENKNGTVYEELTLFVWYEKDL